MTLKTELEEKTPDWGGDRYLGELVRLYCPNMYGQPVYFRDGTRIPYTITIPKFSMIAAEDLANG